MLKAVARTCVDCTTQLNNAIKKEIYQKLEADSGIYLSKDAQLLASIFFPFTKFVFRKLPCDLSFGPQRRCEGYVPNLMQPGGYIVHIHSIHSY